MWKRILQIVGILFAFEGVLFIAVVLTSMTDDNPPEIGRYFYWTLKYVFGFPLVLFNSDFPFFLSNNKFPITAIFMIPLNNLIVALCIYGLLRIVSTRFDGTSS